MGLTNEQYNEIMREYEYRRIANHRLSEARLEEAYQKDPQLKNIDHSIAGFSVAAARKLLGGEPNAIAELKASLAELRTERTERLAQLNFPPDYFDPVYTCADCRDTGYIDGKKCHCLKQAIIDTVYTQSNLRNILNRENFDALSLDFYSSGTNSAGNGISELDNMRNAVAECHRFVDDFENKPKNLLLMGNVGVGKTFLSNCVAKELLDKGNSVIYFSSHELFGNLSKGYFEKNAELIEANKNIFDCDLLIIDDLGTELANSFSVSQLFLCVNERLLRQKSTIISTNLNLSQLADTYSERVVSRISSGYTVIKLIAQDIRLQKRRNNL